MNVMEMVFHWNEMKLKAKLISVLVAVGVLSVVIIGLMGYNSGKSAVETLAMRQLTMARDMRKEFLVTYYETMENSIVTLANDEMLLNAARDFTNGYYQYAKESKVDFDVIRQENRKVVDEFIALTNEKSKSKYTAADLFSDNPNGNIARNHYITNNPFKQGERNKLEFAQDGTTYSGFHAKYHPLMKLYIERFKYYDIFIIDNSGEVVYSYFKEMDFGTNLATGGLKESNLGMVFNELRNKNDRQSVVSSKFEFYGPSMGAPAQFLGIPILDGNTRLGTLIVQNPIEEINKVLTGNKKWKEMGMGDSGEVYVVSSDYKMRSDSRGMIEDAKGFAELLRKTDIDASLIDKMESLKSTILMMDVKSESVKEALNDQTGNKIIKDYRGVEVLSAFAPVTTLAGKWAVIAEIDADEAFAESSSLLRNLVILALIMIASVVLLAIYLARSIIRPVDHLIEMTKDMTGEVRNGNLAARMETDGVGIDFKDIPPGINGILDAMVAPITEASKVMAEMANGNLQEYVKGDYKGDHAEIKNALNKTLDSFNEILGSLNIAVDEMQNGASQISDASQSLSQGSTEQAASVEEISSAVTQLSTQTRQATANAKRANELSAKTLDSSKKGGEMMSELMTAMHQIKSAADNISKIIKAIDEIAFQTNLLSLNAAVEAARAGRHGKGFAVVAEEVKSLSDRSAKAARETADLIQESITRANNGASIAEKTVESLLEISSSVEEVAKLMKEVAAASEEQTVGLTEVEKSIQQIEQVTQNNAANSEETASASAELAGQAESITEMVGKFKIKGDFVKLGSEKKMKQIHLHNEHKQGNGHHPQPEKKEIAAKPVKAKPSAVISLEDDEFGKY